MSHHTSEPKLNYLAKDYASFRQLLLDRMSILAPEWKERNVAGLGMALVELLSYVGDHLSYQQDAIATEAHLRTARLRISARRHARLMDYDVHESTNAHTWIQVEVKEDVTTTIPKGTKVLTKIPNHPSVLPHHFSKLKEVDAIFETLIDHKNLYKSHNTMSLSKEESFLPKGATRATVEGDLSTLKGGDYLIFWEKHKGESPPSGPEKMHCVRLTYRTINLDTKVTEIFWEEEDALPTSFSISLSHRTTCILGNVIPVDHGCTLPSSEQLPNTLNLSKKPLTFAFPFALSAPAQKAWDTSNKKVLPQIQLKSASDGQDEWELKRDLLKSDRLTKAFMIEMDNAGAAFVRFGDGQYGEKPSAQESFHATYRVGGGTQGNVGAGSLTHIVSDDLKGVEKVWNPLPAWGGTPAESMESIRQSAPFAFRKKERAVTEEDYAEIARRFYDVRRAVAKFRWTGSWHTVFIIIDRKEGRPVDEAFKEKIKEYMEPFRMAGYDIEISSAHLVPLEISMVVTLKPNALRSEVGRTLEQLFHSQRNGDGSLGMFHPDQFTFGQTIQYSPLYAAAQSVEGVSSVKITQFKRQGVQASPLRPLVLEPLEIAQLDNDPSSPERGVFTISLEGGR